jgi:hypothetical protein
MHGILEREESVSGLQELRYWQGHFRHQVQNQDLRSSQEQESKILFSM